MNIDFFDPIKLKEIDKVQLMNRTDQKYWFHYAYLPELLKQVREDYYLLHIGGKSQLPYATTYFDTEDNQMFSSHHNGKLNRFKIRKRDYVDSGIGFLEIKFKNNKGRTIKTRIPSNSDNSKFTCSEDQFISTQSPFASNELSLSLVNKFSRITLVNKNFRERCTIDLDLQFEISDRIVTLDNIVIVEVKSDGKSNASPLAMVLRENRIKPNGFSKYCIGRSITDPLLKQNAFKEKIRALKKITKTNIHIN